MLEEHLLNFSQNHTIPKDHVNYLYKLKEEGFEPKVIYDIGSSLTHWAKVVKNIWPEAKIILFDAFQPAEFLYKDYDYNIGLLSNTDGKKIKFYQNNYWPGGNSYYRENTEYFPEDKYIVMEAKTLDTIVKERGFPLPNFIKIDTQGSEIDILEGATNTIRNATKMVIELQHKEYNLGAKLANDSLKIIENMGWKCTDPLFCNNGVDGDYGFTSVNIGNKVMLNKITIGLEGISTFGKKAIEFLVNKIYPNSEIEYKNDSTCDFIIDSHHDANNPDWNSDITKKYIYWSGESFPPFERKERINKFYILSTVNDKQNYLHIPFCLYSPFINKPRKYNNNDRKYLLAYCSSRPTKEREDLFNFFIEKSGENQCHAYGNCFGKYVSAKKEKAPGIWDSDNLIDIYKDYKFVIAMENNKKIGYVTEKIVNAFHSGAIPIYWGAADINNYFNKKAFINVDNFSSFEKCVEYVINMSEDARKRMLSEPIYNETNDLIHLMDEEYNKRNVNVTLNTYTEKLKNFLQLDYKKTTELQSILKVAIFSGFTFHYEMFGYIIYYCKVKNYNLTIYCDINGDKLGYINTYKKMFNKYHIEYKQIGDCFDIEKHNFDIIFLTTDDDALFKKNNQMVNNKTICIDHNYIIRAPEFTHRVATRPFSEKYYREYVLPIYPTISINKKLEYLQNNQSVNIVILGNNNDISCITKVILLNYITDIINRLKAKNNKIIVIKAISRYVSLEQFKGLDKNIKLECYENINTYELFNILYNAHYILSDVTLNVDRVDKTMAGCIPLSLSMFAPLIIEKKTNSYYKFKNVIEFDKDSTEDIILEDIDIHLIEKERQEMLNKNHSLFDSTINSIMNKIVNKSSKKDIIYTELIVPIVNNAFELNIFTSNRLNIKLTSQFDIVYEILLVLDNKSQYAILKNNIQVYSSIGEIASNSCYEFINLKIEITNHELIINKNELIFLRHQLPQDIFIIKNVFTG